MSNDMKQWRIVVSKETDEAVRALLIRQGREEDKLSKFVEDAIRRRMFDPTIAEARERLVDLSAREIEPLIDEAVNDGGGGSSCS